MSSYNPIVVNALLKSVGVPPPEYEHQFANGLGRKFRFDLAWPEYLLAVEVQGGLWNGGAHSRAMWIVKEHEKRNLAAELGWRILYVEPKDMLRTATAELVRRCLSSAVKFHGHD